MRMLLRDLMASEIDAKSITRRVADLLSGELYSRLEMACHLHLLFKKLPTPWQDMLQSAKIMDSYPLLNQRSLLMEATQLMSVQLHLKEPSLLL